MLTVFNDPQDKGLLCISYPMVEAIKHQKGTEFTEELHTITDLVNYKRWVNANNEFSKRYSNWGLYDKCTWDEINKHHLARANLLVNNALELPSEVFTQKCIFQCQLNKHTPNSRVAVISSFPLMLYDYYGQRIFD